MFSSSTGNDFSFGTVTAKVNESPRITIRLVSLAALALTGLFLRSYSFMETW